MLLIIMILSMPVYGQAGVNDFTVDLNVGINAPQWDERLGHFDILPELLVVSSRPEENATAGMYTIIDTVYVSAKRHVPATAYQKTRAGHGGTMPDYLRYALYIAITIIATSMAAITINRMPIGFRKNRVCGRPAAVRLHLFWRRKR